MKIMLSAGEASGDLHGANLAEALKAVDPQVELIGMGGEQMRKAGVRIVYDIKKSRCYRHRRDYKKDTFFYKLRTFLVNTMKEEKPDALVVSTIRGLI